MKDRSSIQRALQILGIQLDATFLRDLLLPSIKIIAINILSALLLFATNYFLIRHIGEEGYGYYVIVNLWLSIFSVICLAGMDDFFIATLPKFSQSSNANGSYATVLRWSLKVFVLITAVVLVIVFALSLSRVLPHAVTANRSCFLGLLPVLALLLLFVNFLRGAGMAVAGQVVDKLVRQGLFFVSILVLVAANRPASLQEVLTVQFFCFLLCTALLFLLIKKVSGPSVPNLLFDQSGKSNLTFLSISLLYLLSTRLDLLFLENQVKPEDLGYYNIAARLADLAAYPVTAMNLLLPVLLSKTYHNQREKLKNAVKGVTGIILAITLAAFVFVFLFGQGLLSIFGPKFIKAYWPLVVLCASQLFAACAAPMNGVLMVSGNQRLSLLALVFFVVVSFSLCFFLVPLYASLGAALSLLGGQAGYVSAVYFFANKKVFSQLLPTG